MLGKEHLKVHSAALIYLSKNDYARLEKLHPMFRFGILNPEEIDEEDNEEQNRRLHNHYLKLSLYIHPDKFNNNKEELKVFAEESCKLINQYKPRKDISMGLKWKFIGGGENADGTNDIVKYNRKLKKSASILLIFYPIILAILLPIVAVLFLAYVIINPFIDLYKHCSFDYEKGDNLLKKQFKEVVFTDEHDAEHKKTVEEALKKKIFPPSYCSIVLDPPKNLAIFVVCTIALPFLIIAGFVLLIVTVCQSTDKLIEAILLPNTMTVEESKKEVGKLQHSFEFTDFCQKYYSGITPENVSAYFTSLTQGTVLSSATTETLGNTSELAAGLN